MSQKWEKSNFELVPTLGRYLRKAAHNKNVCHQIYDLKFFEDTCFYINDNKNEPSKCPSISTYVRQECMQRRKWRKIASLWQFELHAKSGPLETGDFGEIGDLGKNRQRAANNGEKRPGPLETGDFGKNRLRAGDNGEKRPAPLETGDFGEIGDLGKKIDWRSGDLGKKTADCRLQTADLRLQTTDCRL